MLFLKGHKSKIDSGTCPGCSTCKVKETPQHFLLNYKEYDTEPAKLENEIKFWENLLWKMK